MSSMDEELQDWFNGAFATLVTASIDIATMSDAECEKDQPSKEFRDHCRAALDKYVEAVDGKLATTEREIKLVDKIKEAQQLWK